MSDNRKYLSENLVDDNELDTVAGGTAAPSQVYSTATVEVVPYDGDICIYKRPSEEGIKGPAAVF